MEESIEHRIASLDGRIRNLDNIYERMRRELLVMPCNTDERRMAEAQMELTKEYRGSLQAEYEHLKSLVNQEK